MSRLSGPAEVRQAEANPEAVHAAVLRLQRAAAAAGAALLPHAVFCVSDAGRGPEERDQVLQGHRHARTLLHEEDSGHDADRVPLLRQ